MTISSAFKKYVSTPSPPATPSENLSPENRSASFRHVFDGLSMPHHRTKSPDKDPIIAMPTPMPNAIQRQQRQKTAISQSIPAVPTSSSIPAPLALSQSNNSVNSISSPIDIFERNVQSEELPPLIHSLSNLSHHSTNSNFSPPPPRHLISENYTSPILDSTVELISSEQFNNTDLIEMPHSNPSSSLFRQSSSPHLARISRSISRSSSKLSFHNNQQQQPQPLSSSSRKSISFYSYTDLINYERSENATATSPELLSANSPLNSRHQPLMRRLTNQGCLEDDDARIDQELFINDKPINKRYQYTPTDEEPPITGDIDDQDADAETDTIRPWNPTYSTYSTQHYRRPSLVEELASLKSTRSHLSAASYFEDELLEEQTQEQKDGQGQQEKEEEDTVPLVQVCSAGDYLNERTRTLCRLHQGNSSRAKV